MSLPLLVPIVILRLELTIRLRGRRASATQPLLSAITYLIRIQVPMGVSQVRGSQVEVEGQITEDEDDEDKSPSVGTNSDSASRTDHSVERPGVRQQPSHS